MAATGTDPLWNSALVRTLAARCDPGGLIRLDRAHRGWRQSDLGERIGCSASTVSRIEQRGRRTDLTVLRRAAREVGVPTHVLAASLGLSTSPATRVARDRPRCAEEADPMRRRTLLAAAGLAGPATLLSSLDDALAVTPDPTGSPVPLDARLAAARATFDAGRHTAFLQGLPGLLGDLHHDVRSRGTDHAHARLSACYGLATAALIKIGRYPQARLTADRASTHAELSGSPLVAASAARELSIVLRHQDQSPAAQRLVHQALRGVERTGLRTDAQASAYAQMLCTTAYTVARADDRDQALAMITEARRAARSLPDEAPAERLFPLTPAAVDLYAVGVHWALGDAGTALDVGRGLHPGHFRTPERKARLHTDLGRAWWQWGKPEQTATELLSAARVSPGEVRDRPAIRTIISDLRTKHPRTPGVRELAAAAGLTAA